MVCHSNCLLTRLASRLRISGCRRSEGLRLVWKIRGRPVCAPNLRCSGCAASPSSATKRTESLQDSSDDLYVKHCKAEKLPKQKAHRRQGSPQEGNILKNYGFGPEAGDRDKRRGRGRGIGGVFSWCVCVCVLKGMRALAGCGVLFLSSSPVSVSAFFDPDYSDNLPSLAESGSAREQRSPPPARFVENVREGSVLRWLPLVVFFGTGDAGMAEHGLLRGLHVPLGLQWLSGLLRIPAEGSVLFLLGATARSTLKGVVLGGNSGTEAEWLRVWRVERLPDVPTPETPFF